jgi:hypothetical protein
MSPVAEVHRPSLLLFLLREGGGAGLALAALGVLLTVWGFINLGFVTRRGTLVTQALVSFLPLSLAFVGMCVYFSRFMELAAAPGSSRPEDVARTMSLLIILGLTGSVSTIVPAVIGIIALARNLRTTEEARARSRKGTETV